MGLSLVRIDQELHKPKKPNDHKNNASYLFKIRCLIHSMLKLKNIMIWDFLVSVEDVEQEAKVIRLPMELTLPMLWPDLTTTKLLSMLPEIVLFLFAPISNKEVRKTEFKNF